MNIEKLRARSSIIRLIRRWFDERGFTEMHTPRLVGLPGQEPYLEPFWTEVVEASGSRHPAALVTSPEYLMKRLLAAGLDRIYDLGPCFRNAEPWDGTHDPEFLMLEWYRRDAGLDDLMRDTEELIRFVASEFTTHDSRLTTLHFRRLTVEEAWHQYAGLELAPLLGDRGAMARACREHGQTVTDADTWDDLYFKVFLSEIEPKLGWAPAHDSRLSTHDSLPTFLYRYPASMAALARKSSDDPRWADRVELYIGDPVSGHGTSLELANGFAELCDPVEQRQRFEEERALRASLGKPTWGIDEKFIAALPGMGDAAGIAFGVDRLVMLLTGSSSINGILPASARERFG